MRLIDADTIFPNDAVIVFENNGAMTADGILKAIKDAPTIDAVPVVRCKDCRHRGDGDVCPMRHIVWSEEEGYYFVDITMDDYYCSFGERRESNDTP